MNPFLNDSWIPQVEGIINKLPNELLIIIFDLIFFSSTPALDEDYQAPPIVHSLSHVSQKWRDIVFQLPHLWTDIRIFHFGCTQPMMTRRALELSRDLPLSIRLEHDGDGDRTVWEVPSWVRRPFELVMDAVLSCVERWESVRVMLRERPFADINTKLRTWSGARSSVPLLRRLELIIAGRINRDLLLDFWLGNAPRLNHLRLHCVRLLVDSRSYVKQLETLELSHTSMEVLSGESLGKIYADEIDILNHRRLSDSSGSRVEALQDVMNPHIRSLSLNACLPFIHQFLSPLYRTFSAYTSSLNSLSISSMTSMVSGSESFDLFLSVYLTTTSLQNLTLEKFDETIWVLFLRALTNPGTGTSLRSPRFPALRMLELNGCPIFPDLPDHFAFNFPVLEVIHLYDLTTEDIDMVLGLLSQPVFRHLHTLKVNKAKYALLCEVVEAREGYGYTIETLEVDSPEVFDVNSLMKLQRKVKNFRRIPRVSSVMSDFP